MVSSTRTVIPGRLITVSSKSDSHYRGTVASSANRNYKLKENDISNKCKRNCLAPLGMANYSAAVCAHCVIRRGQRVTGAIPALFRTSDKYSGIFHILIREWIINSIRLLCCIFRCKESKIICKYSIQWTVKCSQIETPLTNNKLQWLSSHMNSSSCFLRKWYQNDTSASYPPAMTGLVKLFIQPSENAICAPFLHGIKLASSS